MPSLFPDSSDVTKHDEINTWIKDKNLNLAQKTTNVGEASIINEQLGLILDPLAKSSQELRDLQKDFKNKNIELYYLYPWENSITKLLSHFESKLHMDTRKFAAKRLDIEIIDNKIGDEFMKAHHIQGAAHGVGKVSIGLIKDNELLAVQQFSRYRFGVTRGKGSVQASPIWEGLRLCFKPGVQIYGGASRLQKFFEQHYEPEKILAYVNLSHSDGSYKTSQGFTDITDWNQLSYMWVAPEEPKIITIIDKNGEKRQNDPEASLKNKYLNPSRMAGSFGRGVGMTLYGAKLGSRKQLRAHPENGELVHNDVILQAVGYSKIYTAGQRKWEKLYA